MPTNNRADDPLPQVMIIAPFDAERFWPVFTKWRAVIEIRGELRSAEWMLKQVKPVPLSSKIERSLLEWARSDDGRSILRHASEPGEHRVAAAVIAALRLADDHPDRALRFLSWIAQGPNDPAELRFLRRYLPGLHVLVRLDPDFGAAVPLGRDALGLLAADLLRATGELQQAEQVLGSLTPSAAVGIARSSLRIAAGDFAGVHALAQDRPVVTDSDVALRIMNARARDLDGDPSAALAEVNALVEGRQLGYAADKAARAVRSNALRATGRDVEADLIDDDFGVTRSEAADDAPPPAEAPRGPLFGRSLADALDDAWARVRRQPSPSPVTPLVDRAEIDMICEEAVALIGATHYEAAEAGLLAAMDRADAWVDEGGDVIDDFYVLLAGLFDRLDMTTEEVATLERLRAAHTRAGSPLPDAVSDRLIDARAILDALA